MQRGRKRLDRAAILQQLIAIIAVGGNDKDAYTIVGISYQTFYEWMQDSEFSEAITRARAQGKVARLSRIQHHGETDWRADAWYLERRYPDEYAQHLIVKLTADQAAVLKKANLKPDDAFAQFVEMIRAEQEAQALEHANPD